jgi:hypothetical protein
LRWSERSFLSASSAGVSGGFVGVIGSIPNAARQLAAPFVPGDVIEKSQLFCGIFVSPT